MRGTVRTQPGPGLDPGRPRDQRIRPGHRGDAGAALQAISVFANDGQLVRPRLVRAIRGPGGEQDLPPEVERQVVSPQTARTVMQMMVAVDEQPDLSPIAYLGTRSPQDGDGGYADERGL